MSKNSRKVVYVLGKNKQVKWRIAYWNYGPKSMTDHISVYQRDQDIEGQFYWKDLGYFGVNYEERSWLPLIIDLMEHGTRLGD